MSTKTAQVGDTVKVNYTGKLQDGSVFDSTEGREPLQFTVGAGELISGFDRSVVGMAEGEKKSVEVPSEEAYGDYREDLVLKLKRDELGPEIDPVEGMTLRMRTASGRFIPVRVSQVGGDEVTIDANHPLAGQDLVFEVELVEIAR